MSEFIARGEAPRAPEKVANRTAIKFGNDVPRQPGAARTKRWEALRAYVRKHRRASLEQVIANTAYTRGDFRIDVARGSLKA